MQPTSKLVHTEAYDPGTVGGGYPGNDAIVTVSFTEEGGVTTVTTLIDFGSKEARDAAVATGMTDGMEQSYQLLDRLLREQAGVCPAHRLSQIGGATRLHAERDAAGWFLIKYQCRPRLLESEVLNSAANSTFKGVPMLNITLWVLQFLLALVFLAHGLLFLFPPASLVEQMNASIAPALRLFIGVAEVLAAVGLTIPGITRVQPGLVVAAAVGLMVVMVCATVFHSARGEGTSALTTAVLLALLAVVAYMRWKVSPLLPRRVA